MRPHTASLTIPGTLLGCVASGHTEPLTLLVFGVWAFWFHCTGFLDNSVQDVSADKNDPEKKHFALVTGEVNITQARAVEILGTLLVFFFGGLLVIAWHAHGIGAVLAAAFLILAVANGLAYNRLSKRSLSAPLFISTSFASLPAFAYFATGGSIGLGMFAYVVIYAWFLIMCQISAAGYIKDLETDPVNLLRTLGARATPLATPGAYDYHFSLPARAWAWSTRLACPLLAIAWMETHTFSPLALVWLIALLLTFRLLLSEGPMLRSRKVLYMSLGEISTYFLLITSLDALLAPWTVLWLILPVFWYAFWNTVLWGRLLAPRV